MLAVGILGATVMPHVVYLHSALVQRRITPRDDAERRSLLRFQRVDVVIAMGLAGLINLTMLVVAASLFHQRAHGIDTHRGRARRQRLIGGGARRRALAFAVALLASGLSSSSVGTYAGQVVMQGFIDPSHPAVPARRCTWRRRGARAARARGGGRARRRRARRRPRALATVLEDPRLAAVRALAVERVPTVADPRLRVLRRRPRRSWRPSCACADAIDVFPEPPSALPDAAVDLRPGERDGHQRTRLASTSRCTAQPMQPTHPTLRPRRDARARDHRHAARDARRPRHGDAAGDPRGTRHRDAAATPAEPATATLPATPAEPATATLMAQPTGGPRCRGVSRRVMTRDIPDVHGPARPDTLRVASPPRHDCPGSLAPLARPAAGRAACSAPPRARRGGAAVVLARRRPAQRVRRRARPRAVGRPALDRRRRRRRAALVRRLHRAVLARRPPRHAAARPARQRRDHARRRRRDAAAPDRRRRRRRAHALGDQQDRHRHQARRPRPADLPLAPLRRVPARHRALGRGDRARRSAAAAAMRARRRGAALAAAAAIAIALVLPRAAARRAAPAALGAAPRCSAARSATRSASCAAATRACSARPPGGRSTPPCCGRRSTRSASRPRSRCSRSPTSPVRSATRSRSRARSAAAWSARCSRSASRPTSRSPRCSPTARSRSGCPRRSGSSALGALRARVARWAREDERGRRARRGDRRARRACARARAPARRAVAPLVRAGARDAVRLCRFGLTAIGHPSDSGSVSPSGRVAAHHARAAARHPR